jgi:taurine dioxygenase
MGFSIVPMDAPMAAEVTGLDLRRPLGRDARDALEAALLEHVLLLFRGQSLSEQEQLAFCAQFGELYLVRNRKDPNGPAFKPESRLVSNQEEHRGSVSQLHDSEMSFHHDTIFKREPQKALCMHALEIPSYGGNTVFTNMYRGYEALPRPLRDEIAGKTALHVYGYTQTERIDISKGFEQYEHASHPVAIRHPVTGRPVLYVNRLMTMRINELPAPASDALLARLFDHAERREFQYEHVWQRGDVVLWDNLVSMHARTDIPKDQRRVIRHTSIKGIAEPAAA